MALVSINELPENILLELFTHVPAHHLVLHCRPVCSLWRDLIDLVTLWKRKCLREGFVTEDWDQPVADWKIFYFLCSLRRNLLRNPCAEEGMTSWQIDSNGGDHWRVESLPGDHGTDFPDSKVKKYFVTSFGMCLKSQLVDLKAEGYWEELLDTFRPEIEVKDWVTFGPGVYSPEPHPPPGSLPGQTVAVPTTSESSWSQTTTSSWPPSSPRP